MIVRRARSRRRAFELQSDAACRMRPETLSQLTVVGKILSLKPQQPGEDFPQPSRSSRSRFPDPTDSGGPVPNMPR